jgi:hypothetical protein
MIHEFGAGRILERNRLYRKHYKTLIASSEERGTMYIDALQGLLAVLRQDFDLAEHRRPEQRSDFLQSLGREMEIEAEDASPEQLGGMN